MTDVTAIDRNYREIGDTTYAVWVAELKRLGSPFLPMADAMYEMARPHTALCLAMGVVENRWGATGYYIKPEHNNPLSLRPWMRGGGPELPPGAVDVLHTPDTGDFLVFDHPAACIREWKRRLVDDPAYKGGVYTKARSVAEMVAIYAPPGDVHGGTGVDNADIGYAKTVATLIRRYAVAEQNQPAGDGTGGPERGPAMAGMKAHNFPGFPNNPVWLPDDIEVQIKIIPSSVPGWTSGQKLGGQTMTTWHDTGNPSSSASGEYNWAAGGGRAEINSPGSYNGIFDKSRIIITQRFDEYVGHAGVDIGNRRSWAFEQAFGTGFDDGLRVGAALHGGIHAAMGWAVDTHLVQHNYWSGKDCPGQIRRRGLWSKVVAMTSDAALRAAGAAAGGKVPDTAPIYATPVPIPELAPYQGKPDFEIPYRVDGDGWVALYMGDRVRAIRDTPRRRFSAGDELVGGPVRKGEEFDVDWLLISTDFPDTYLTPWLTRIRAEDTERVADVKQAA